jgi:hypothetical protein
VWERARTLGDGSGHDANDGQHHHRDDSNVCPDDGSTHRNGDAGDDHGYSDHHDFDDHYHNFDYYYHNFDDHHDSHRHYHDFDCHYHRNHHVDGD